MTSIAEQLEVALRTLEWADAARADDLDRGKVAPEPIVATETGTVHAEARAWGGFYRSIDNQHIDFKLPPERGDFGIVADVAPRTPAEAICPACFLIVPSHLLCDDGLCVDCSAVPPRVGYVPRSTRKPD